MGRISASDGGKAVVTGGQNFPAGDGRPTGLGTVPHGTADPGDAPLVTTRSARRLSARTAAAALIGVTTCCAYLALSGGVAKGDTTWTTSTGAPTTVTTIDDTFGPAGSVDPAPTTTAPPTTEAPTTTVPPTTTPSPTTTSPDDVFSPVTVLPDPIIPVPTTTFVPATIPSPATSVPSSPSPVPTLPTATTQPSTAGSLPNSPTTTTPTDTVATTMPATTAATATTATGGVAADPTTTTADGTVAESGGQAGTTTNPTSATILGGKIEGSLASGGPVLEPFTVELPLPGSDSSISIEVRPSRLAAAWLLWVTVSLLVVAFWLPSPARRLATSSVPQRHRR